MPYSPFKHDRQSIRLKDYDYSLDGLYFITICTQNHKCLLGTVLDDLMVLNTAGVMVEKWWLKCAEKFPSIALYDYVVMPNHFHGIIVLNGEEFCSDLALPDTKKGRHAGLPLHQIVQWFKTMVTNDYMGHVKRSGWARFDKRLWQRNYYEHVIRSEKSYQCIAQYIAGNPSKWQDDKYYKIG